MSNMGQVGGRMDPDLKGHMEQCAFRSRVQQEGETFDDFLVSLHKLTKTCNFCNNACTPENIHDQVISGLADGEGMEYLLKEKNLTLDIQTSARVNKTTKHRAPMLASTLYMCITVK